MRRRAVSGCALVLLLLLGGCATVKDSAPSARVKQPTKTKPQATTPARLKVGLLLPLSGAQAPLGQALQNAAQMAVFDENSGQLELLTRDTGDTPQQAAQAFNELSGKGVQLVVGPLFAAQVAAVKPLATQRKLPLLALSNDSSLAAPGTYVLGFSPAAQVSRVLDHACKEGSRRIVALLPGGAYGDVVQRAAQQSVQRCHGATLTVQRYESGAAQLASQLQDMTTRRQSLDTVLLAEAPALLQQTAFPPPLTGRQVRLLGTGLWQVPGIGRQVPALQQAWFAAPDSSGRAQFTQQYQAIYGSTPPALAGLTYDTVALAGTLQKRGQLPDSANLTLAVGFRGVDGIFRLLPNGQVERALTVLRITSSGYDVLDHAPDSFEASASTQPATQ